MVLTNKRDACALLLLLLLLMCLSFTLAGVHTFSGHLPPPENLSLSWDPSSLSVNVHWRKPADLDSKCKVNYTLAIYYEKCPPRRISSDKRQTESFSHIYYISKEDEICVGITTNPMVCENRHASKEVYKGLSPPPALVKNFSCAYYSNNKMNCTWTVVKYTTDLKLSYREDFKKPLKPCISYHTYGTTKTGCHLHDEHLSPYVVLYFVISGTGENHLINNRFMIDIRNSAVKPLKPKISITQEGERLGFQASTPDFLGPQCWKYKYTYSKCNEEVVVESDKSSTYVEYDTACKYTVRGQVIYSNSCGGDKDIESDMGEPVYYGEDGDPNLAYKVAMIVTPLIVCCCLIAAIVLFRRNKDIILPKIPEPSLFFKDMLNNTSDGLSKSLGGGKLYVPVKEVVASGITLEPNSLLLHPNHDTCI